MTAPDGPPPPSVTGGTPTPGDRGDEGPVVGLAEASKLCGVSESTLRRRRDQLTDRGAKQRDDGSWAIPIAALVDLKLLDRVTAPDSPPPPSAMGGTPAPTDRGDDTPAVTVSVPMAEWSEMQTRIQVAEARLEEKERALVIAEQALRAIEPPPAPSVVDVREEGRDADLIGMPLPGVRPAAPPPPPVKKQRWWRRSRGVS